MNTLTAIHTNKDGLIEVKIMGPDNICDPVLNFLIMRLVNDKRTFSLYFNDLEPEV